MTAAYDYHIKMYLQEELDGLAAQYPGRFKIYFVLNQVSCLSFLTLPDMNISSIDDTYLCLLVY